MTTLTTTIGQIVRGDREVFPPYLYAAYQSTRLRAPAQPLVEMPLTLSELTGPGPVVSRVTPEDADMTRNSGTGGEAIGQRIILTGRVLEPDRGVPEEPVVLVANRRLAMERADLDEPLELSRGHPRFRSRRASAVRRCAW